MSLAHDLGFVHVHVAPPAASTDPSTLLLLHGTGGTERDLLQLAALVAPDARVVGVRGQVLENGMPRFFRRLAEGVFDEVDVVRRAADLSAFVTAAAAAYGFDPTRVIALGYSNGANIAAAMLLLHPGTLGGAVLLRSMVPLQSVVAPALAGLPVLMAQGSQDPIIPRANAERLAAMLTEAGADVALHWEATGHGLTQRDVEVVRDWLASNRDGPVRP